MKTIARIIFEHQSFQNRTHPSIKNKIRCYLYKIILNFYDFQYQIKLLNKKNLFNNFFKMLFLYYHFKKSALLGWERVDTLFQSKDPNPTKRTH